MNIERIFTMIFRRLFGRLLNRGVNAGIDMAAGGGRPRAQTRRAPARPAGPTSRPPRPTGRACHSQAAVNRLTRLEMFGQLQPLSLIVRRQPGAVETSGHVRHLFIDQPPDDLPVFQREGRLVAAHLQHPA